MAKEMRSRGDEVTVIGPLRKDGVEPGCQGFGGVVNIPSNGGANHVAMLTPPWAVRRFFRSVRFDVVHVHEPLVPLLPYYALWSSSQAAHVCTFHMYAEREPRGSQLARKLAGRLTVSSYERGIAVSLPARRHAEVGWDKDLTVIPNGVATRTFVPGHRHPRRPTARDPLRLLFVGRWEDRRKGLSRLLEAYGRLRAAGLPVTLDVVGAGPLHKVQALPGVTFHGVVPSTSALAAHYRRCDIFVSPALGQESFGMVVLEAMSSARPVVCSDIAGYRQLVDRRGARLVPPGDAIGLAQAIAGLAHDPGARRAMGELNRARAEAYDWSDVTERIRAQYLEAIGERHGLAAARAHEQAVAEPGWSGAAAQVTLLRSRS